MTILGLSRQRHAVKALAVAALLVGRCDQEPGS
jgi:hypothetical protein